MSRAQEQKRARRAKRSKRKAKEIILNSETTDVEGGTVTHEVVLSNDQVIDRTVERYEGRADYRAYLAKKQGS